MKLDPNDAKLTAYILGELADDAARREIDDAVATCPESRALMDDLRRFTAELGTDLQAEPSPGLTPAQRQELAATAATVVRASHRTSIRTWLGRGLVLAAVAWLIVLFGLVVPRYAAVYDDMLAGQPLPALTSQVIRCSYVLFDHWVLLLAILASAVAVWRWRRMTALPPPWARRLGRVLASPALVLPATCLVTGIVALALHLPQVTLIECLGGDGTTASNIQRSITPSLSPRPMPAYVNGSDDAINGPLASDIETEQPTDSPFGQNTEAYDRIVDNPFRSVADRPVSTFAIDVDTAAYANVRRFLTHGQRPPKDAVRIEEMINYFPYAYPPPDTDAPFSASMAVVDCPWQQEHRLVRIGLRGREVTEDDDIVKNLVFLLDVSGSMDSPSKLPLLREAMKLLVDRLGERDRVAIVVYAGASGLVLPSTLCANRAEIIAALDRLQAGGSTNGGAGIHLAYRVAAENFVGDGVNRVILCTDGDFNVGVTGPGGLTRLIEAKARSGIFLSVLGFGMGNYQDALLEKLADKGNGNYGYIDTINEARKMLGDQMQGTLVTIAKDVKIQVEFNPTRVSAYRLIGYENRLLRKEDFNDDTKDAGEIGAGHTVTALYEIAPAGVPAPGAAAVVDPLRYQHSEPLPSPAAASDELLTLKLRYKQPDSDASSLLEFPLHDEDNRFAEADDDLRFAAMVAAFGMILRQSPYRGNITLAGVAEIATDAVGNDPFGYRGEFFELVSRAQRLPGLENENGSGDVPDSEVARLGSHSPASNLVALKLELPKPLFIGTPKNIRTPNLEPPRRGKRAPFFVPRGTRNLALERSVTASDMEPIIGDLEQVTDGDKLGDDGSYVELGPGRQWVQIDLGAACNIYALVVWHYHSQARVYRDVVVQVTDDADFITNVRTVFNNDHDNSSGLGVGHDYEYIETYEGRLMDAKGVNARYVRLYSNGSTSSEMNHYTEVEVYGLPAQ